MALDLDIAVAIQGAKVEAKTIESVKKNGADAPPEFINKSTGNKMFFNVVSKMRRMKGLR